jgi:fibronectin type 3 domain-containing protein
MFKYRLFTFFIVLLFSYNAGFSQRAGVALLCSPRKDSILLRWAPTDQKVWKIGNQFGYTILRYTILKDKEIPKVFTSVKLTKEPLKPSPLAEWEPFSDDKYVAIAAECIFNDQFKGIKTGGDPFMAVKKYKNDIHRFSFALYAADQSIKAATLSGLYFADKSAQPNEKYLYKVFITTPDTTFRIDTATAFTGISEYQPLPKPLDFRADWGDKSVSLSWNFRYLKHIFNSYIVEKSDDGGKTYKAISDNATVQLADEGVSPELIFKSDTFINNDIIHYYRVKGVSAFGEQGPPSDSVFGKGIKPIVSAPVIKENIAINNKKIKLSWDYPADMNQYISGFRIYRSSKPKGRKSRVYESKSSEERTYTDSTPDITNYYLISVFNATKEKLSSIITYSELVDSIPPLQPKNVTGAIDSIGKVLIKWNRNKDKDIDGYRVYSSNNPKFEFILETPAVLKDTTFTDTINLKTLTSNIYYRVKAIDVRQNQSEFSEILTLKRPDIIPPVSPVIKTIEEQNGNITLTWVNSSSIDVAFHHIFRKEKNDTLFQEIAKFQRVDDIRSTYIDKKVKSGKEYIYSVKAEDNSGLFSAPSKTVGCKTAGIKESIKLTKREQTDRVKLLWNIKSDKKVVKILIYRSVDGSPLHLYDNSLDDSYFDTKLSPEKTYEYRIKAVYEDGSSSELSNTVKVKM